MTKAAPPSLPTEIWVGWGHLDGLLKNVGALTEVGQGSLVQRNLSPTSLAILRKCAHVAPELLSLAATGVKLDPKIFDDLLKSIGDLLDRAEDRFWYQRHFLEIIDRGNHSGRFAIPITWVPLPPIPEAPSPFQQSRFEAAAAIKPLISDFIDSLRIPIQPHKDTRWGRVMLSAILFGGLPRARWLLAIPTAMQRDADPELRWLDLVIEVTDRPPRQRRAGAAKRKHTEVPEAKFRVLRRWFPDPLTRILLREINQNAPPVPTAAPGANDTAVVWREIKRYLMQYTATEHLPSSFGRLADAVKTRMHQYLPPYLVEYAFENIESTSLSGFAWKRLVEPPERLTKELPTTSVEQLPTGPMPAASQTPEPESPKATVPAQQPSSEDDDIISLIEEDLWPDQLRELRHIVRQDYDHARERIRDWLNLHATSMLPSVRWIAMWVVDRLLATGPQKRPNRRSTIYQFLRTAGAQLAAHLAGADPTLLGDEDDYADLYEEVLDDASGTSLAVRRTTANALRSFHSYLMDQCPTVPAVETTGVFVVSGRGGHRVDANVVGLSTYFLALRELKQANASSQPAEVIEALVRIAGLGYFASLRRSEAIGLTVADVIMSGEEVILEVRPNPTRLLKTDNSWRRLPLHVLMPPAELRAFCAWVKGQRAAGGGMTSPLFPMFVRKRGVRDTDPRLALIVSALQTATGDPTVRFHHLRHSFATWQAVQFWIAEQRAQHRAIPVWFLPTEHDLKRWRIAKRARDQLLGDATTNRRSILQISQLLGHGSLDITLGSYVHLLDLLLGLTIRRMAPEIDLSALAVLIGGDEDKLRRLRDAHPPVSPANADDANAIWLDTVFAGPRQRGRPRRKAPALATVDFTEPAQLIAPTQPFARLMHEMEAVNVWLASGQHDLDIVATRYDLPPMLIAAAAEGLRKLPPGMSVNFLTRTPSEDSGTVSMTAFVPRYSPPHGEAQEHLAKLVVTSIERMRAKEDGEPDASHSKRGALVTRALLAFVNGWVPETYLAAQFQEVRQARDWLWLLDHVELGIGVTLGQLVQVIHVPGKGPSTRRAHVQRVYWLRQLRRKPYRSSDANFLEAHSNSHIRGVVIIDICRQKLPTLPSPLKRIANFEAVRLTLVAALCRLSPIELKKLAIPHGDQPISADAGPVTDT